MLGAVLVHTAIWKKLYFPPLVATGIRDFFFFFNKTSLFVFNPSRQNHLWPHAGWSWWGGGARGGLGLLCLPAPRVGWVSGPIAARVTQPFLPATGK